MHCIYDYYLFAQQDGIDINEACSLTAMQAAEAWRDWSRYRAPFKTAEVWLVICHKAIATYSAKHTPQTHTHTSLTDGGAGRCPEAGEEGVSQTVGPQTTDDK